MYLHHLTPAIPDDSTKSLIPFLKWWGIPLSSESDEQIREFYRYSLEWNTNTFLFASCTYTYWVVHHLLDSLLPLVMIPGLESYLKDKNVMDFGSGGGYPGIVLHMIFGYPITLCDVTQRKLEFYEALQKRFSLEQLKWKDGNSKAEPTQDVVLTRAVGTMEMILKKSRKFRVTEGSLLLWKGLKTRVWEEWHACQVSTRSLFNGILYSYELPAESKQRSVLHLIPHTPLDAND
jgi:16S rRNA (guanine527-N7)-methyltransferase